MTESITFNYIDKIIIVEFNDGTIKEYTDRESYITDFPNRAADCDAMGW
jgi:hypothetical protein